MAKIGKVQEISIKYLNPYSKNAKKHSNEQVDKICASIKEFGFLNPVLIDEEKNIIAGHGRVIAAEKLGMEKVPCLNVEGLSEEQYRAYVLADNRLTELGEWDMDLVNSELIELQELDFDITLTGFDLELNLDDVSVVEDDFVETDTEEEPRAKYGDIYKLGNNRLMCGDSTNISDIEKLLDNNKIDMIYTDPPYGMNLDTDYSSMVNNLDFAKEKSFRGGKKYSQGIVDDFNPEMINTILALDIKETFLWGADYFAELLPNKNDGSWIVWDKRANGNDDIEEDYSSDKMYGSCFELCWSKNKHKRDIARVKWAGVFGTEKEFDHKRHHPTQKPVKLSEWFIKKYSNENDKILDLFGGSGSTLIACEQLKRECYIMEYDAHYVDVIIQRWENFSGQKAELINKGE